MFSILLKRYKHAQGIPRLGWRTVLELTRRVLILLGDPAVSWNLNRYRLFLPASHKLPIYKADYPLYDELPGRISDFVRSTFGSLSMVDIGANVGDTILACYKDTSDHFVAVEANLKFLGYLRRNTKNIEHITLIQAFCFSGASHPNGFQVQIGDGTSQIIARQIGGVSIPARTLDEIIEQAGVGIFNFLKVDTDGHDFEVIEGGKRAIAESMPIVLMECDDFGKSSYVQEFHRTMEMLREFGYSTAIFYDNLGHLFNVLDLSDSPHFRYALLYQQLRKNFYYDLLVLPRQLGYDFLKSEFSYFDGMLLRPDAGGITPGGNSLE